MENLTKKITKALSQDGQVVFAYLFGSQAEKDNYYRPQDIDIAIYVQQTTELQEARLNIYGALCRALGRNDIDIVLLNNAHNLILMDEIIRHGILLLDRDTDLREDFELKILHQAIDFKTQRQSLIGV